MASLRDTNNRSTPGGRCQKPMIQRTLRPSSTTKSGSYLGRATTTTNDTRQPIVACDRPGYLRDPRHIVAPGLLGGMDTGGRSKDAAGGSERGRAEALQGRCRAVRARAVSGPSPRRRLPGGQDRPGRPHPCRGCRNRRRRLRDQDRRAGGAGPRLGRSVLRRECPGCSRPWSPRASGSATSASGPGSRWPECPSQRHPGAEPDAFNADLIDQPPQQPQTPPASAQLVGFAIG